MAGRERERKTVTEWVGEKAHNNYYRNWARLSFAARRDRDDSRPSRVRGSLNTTRARTQTRSSRNTRRPLFRCLFYSFACFAIFRPVNSGPEHELCLSLSSVSYVYENLTMVSFDFCELKPTPYLTKFDS